MLPMILFAILVVPTHTGVPLLVDLMQDQERVQAMAQPQGTETEWCASCMCCNDWCTEIAGYVLNPNGVVGASYCPDGCEIDWGGCAETERIPEGLALKEVLAEVWTAAAMEDDTKLSELATLLPEIVVFQPARRGVQIRGCEGRVMAHLPLLASTADRLARRLHRIGQGGMQTR